jgi:hypothetical protein
MDYRAARVALLPWVSQQPLPAGDPPLLLQRLLPRNEIRRR